MNKLFLFTSKNSYFPLTLAFWSAWLRPLSYKTTEQEHYTWVRERAVHWLNLLNEYTFTEQVSVFSLTQSDYVWERQNWCNWQITFMKKNMTEQWEKGRVFKSFSSSWEFIRLTPRIMCRVDKMQENDKTTLYYILESLICFADM